MVVEPKVKGFLCVTAHPEGCAANVREQIEYVKGKGPIKNGAKSVGGATLGTVNITPIKLEYSARVSDEFMRADEEYQLNVLEEFAEGAAKKFARALDLAAFHGVNPRTNADSSVVGENNFDDKIENVITYASATPDDKLRELFGH